MFKDQKKMMTFAFVAIILLIALGIFSNWDKIFSDGDNKPKDTEDISAKIVAIIDDVYITRADFDPYRGLLAYISGLDAIEMETNLDFNEYVLDMILDQYFMDLYYSSNSIEISDTELDATLNEILVSLYGNMTSEEITADQELFGFDDSIVARIVRGNLAYEKCIEAALPNFDLDDVSLKQYFDDNLDYFTYAEDYWHLRHILVATEPEILDVLNRLGQGENFEALAIELSLDGSAADGGNLGIVTSSINYVAPFKEAALALKADGELSGAVQSEYGWHVIKLEKFIPTGTIADFDELKEDLRRDLGLEQATQMIQTGIGELYNSATIETIIEAVYSAPAP